MKLSKNISSKIFNDRAVRLATISKSHYWFFNIYLSHYVSHETAHFQKELFLLSENKDKLLVVTAFRGSAKSTIMSLSYPLWAIMGEPQKKFVLLISQTQQKAQDMLQHIKRELESNEILHKDLGPFREEKDKWGAQALILTNYKAKIAIASVEQSVRGIRHNQYRPDLVIIDDIEDIQSVKTKEGRDKTFNWLMGEVFPAGDRNTKFVIIGNLLHQDSVIKRMEQKIKNSDIQGTYKEYPVIDEYGIPLWTGKYPSRASVYEEEKMYDRITFAREFMLKILPSDEQVILEDWITYYDELPSDFRQYRKIAVDLAISEKDSADHTAALCMDVYGCNEDMKIYILPEKIHKKMNFPDAIAEIKDFAERLSEYGNPVEVIVEDVAYQKAFFQQLKKEGYPSKGMSVEGLDKRARLSYTTHLVRSGRVLFPRHGAEDLITQLIGFGVEKHDDLVDAFTMLIREAMANKKTFMNPNIQLKKPDKIGGGNRHYNYP